MPQGTSKFQAEPHLTQTEDRRVRVRHTRQLKTYCQRGEGELDQVWWVGYVRDISTAGIGLVIPQRFEPDTTLTVEVESRHSDESRAVQVRVVHAAPQPGGGWLLGCAFARELTGPELAALLD